MQPSSNDIHGIMAMRPDNGAIEKARLYENHFGRGHHAIRFESDGMNAPMHSERNVPWEPLKAGVA
jgi:hypothetical protein